MSTEMHFEENEDNTFQASGVCFTNRNSIDERPDKWMISYDTISKL